MTNSVSETYVAAIQHDLVDLDGAAPIGVVRRPPGWFHAVVDENVRALGPPDDLLDDVVDCREDLKMRGICDEEAHNAAWEAVDFETRYRSHLEDDPDATEALDRLRDRVRGGDDVALVCFESDSKRCHRHTLMEILEADG